MSLKDFYEADIVFNLKDDNSYEKKYECKKFGSSGYGIGPEIK